MAGEVETCPFGVGGHVGCCTRQCIKSESGCKITAISWAVE